MVGYQHVVALVHRCYAPRQTLLDGSLLSADFADRVPVCSAFLTDAVGLA